MLRKRESMATQHSQGSSRQKSEKILCTRCVKSIPAYQYNLHYESCGIKTEYAIYHPKPKFQIFMKIDEDKFDLPIASQYIESQQIAENQDEGVRLPIQKFAGNSNLTMCSFCANRIYNSEKVIILPCRHALHRSCLKKWNIIVDPCRKCNS